MIKLKSPLLARPGVDIPGRPVMIETGAGFLLSRPSPAHYRGLGPETRLEQVAGSPGPTNLPTYLGRPTGSAAPRPII